MKRLWMRFSIIFLVLIVSIVYLLPTFFSEKINFLPKKRILLGLDLQGGMHLILGVEVKKAVSAVFSRIIDDIKSQMDKELIGYIKVEKPAYNRVVFILPNRKEAKRLKDLIKDRFPKLSLGKERVKNTLYELEIILPEKEVKKIEERAIEQAVETIRNRVDQFGVAEPTIRKQGKDEILVELPGIKDTKRAISVIGKTARLEFKLVDEGASVDEALKKGPPPGDEILYKVERDPVTGEISKTPYLLRKEVLLTGDLLSDARVNIDPVYREPYVIIRFNSQGAKIFERITGENVGKRLAIILDNNVYSAPVIQERIAGGSARITGNFTPEEAHDLAIVLRAGALPAPVNILENRTVGPSLGKDSIRKGIISIIFGGILVVIFMVIYYRFAGFIADLALIFNLVIILSVLAMFGATLTLPGIAGIVLTIGMAVDANVLIFERIREELRQGKSYMAAIQAGYARAFITILDSNVTTILAALILFQFGTGPIRGFAVTLSVGIVASFFTAIFVTRTIFEYILFGLKWKAVSI